MCRCVENMRKLERGIINEWLLLRERKVLSPIWSSQLKSTPIVSITQKYMRLLYITDLNAKYFHFRSCINCNWQSFVICTESETHLHVFFYVNIGE